MYVIVYVWVYVHLYNILVCVYMYVCCMYIYRVCLVVWYSDTDSFVQSEPITGDPDPIRICVRRGADILAI